MRNVNLQAIYRVLVVSWRLWFRNIFAQDKGCACVRSTYRPFSHGIFNELRFYCRVTQPSARSISSSSAPSPAPFQTRVARLNVGQNIHVSSTKPQLGRAITHLSIKSITSGVSLLFMPPCFLFVPTRHPSAGKYCA